MRTVKSEESVYQRTEYIELASQAAKTLLKHKQASAAAEMANSMLTVFRDYQCTDDEYRKSSRPFLLNSAEDQKITER